MTLSRRDRILVLAWSLPDALRALASRSTETRRLSPAQWQLCTPCDGNGTMPDRWGKHSTCSTCRGAGRYLTDPYAMDNTPVSVMGDELQSRTLTRDFTCDRCDGTGIIPHRWLIPDTIGFVACPKCDGTGHLQIPLEQTADGRAEAALDAIAWRLGLGDWDALDTALETMRSNGRRPLWRAFVAAYVEPPYVIRAEAPLALSAVDDLMPNRIRVPKEIVTAYAQRLERDRLSVAKRSERMGRGHRNREIRAALKLGHSTEQVALMFALSESQVRRIS